MPWKRLVAVALALGAANMTTDTAFSRGMSGGAHFVGGGLANRGAPFVGGGFATHRFAIRRGFVRPFRRNLAAGGFWPYYDYFPTDAYGNLDTATYPATAGSAPEPTLAPLCHRSEEIVRVPSEGGGTSQIRITRCP
jgi:hypothetical protein